MTCPSTCSRRDQAHALQRAWSCDRLAGTTGLMLQVPAARCQLAQPLCKAVSFARGRAVSFWPSMLAPQLRSVPLQYLLVLLSVHRGTAQLACTNLAPTAGEARM